LAPFAVAETVVGPGITGRVRVADWPEPIKISAEASFIVPGGFFVAWETSYTNPVEKNAAQDHQPKIFNRIGSSFEAAADIFGLKLEF